MLTIDNLTYRAGPRTLLENTSAMIPPGHRVGLVGRNGSGKTTLLRLITRTLDPDGGSISFPSQWRVGITSQEAPDGTGSLIETVLAADTELTDLLAEAENITDPNRIAEVHLRLNEKNAPAAPSRAAKLLAGLGFSEADQQRPCNEFSGGWRMRVALAALLFTEPDLLLLDEPTNHLDLEATLWLEGYLKRYLGTVLLVSHDRDILNRAVDQILHLENNTLTLYSGNYDRFENTRKAQLDQIERARGRQMAERERISKFVERFRYKASKARQAQSRLKMLERMEPIADYNQEGVVSFAFPDPDPPPPPLFNARDVAIGYDGTPVLRDITLRLDPDDRIALIGANGNGKSTLIKLLAGRLEPLEGEIGKARRIRVGYFAQHQSEELDMDATPLIQLARRRPSETEQKLRNHLGRFGFTQERSKTRIRNLSGGEKARLLFALMSGDAPHILLLDEPTNHLDIQSREALVQAINAFEGAVVIVSHDPHVVALTTDRLWLVADGTVTQFDGDLDDYRATVLEQSRGNGQGAKKQATKRDRKEERRAAAERRKQVSPLRKQLNRAEKAVERLEVKKFDIQAEMGKPETYNNNDLLLTLQKDLGWAQKELEVAESRWLNLHEELEAVQKENEQL